MKDDKEIESKPVPLSVLFATRRKELNLSCKQLGEKAGVNLQAVWRLEQNKLRLTKSVVEKIRVALDIEIPVESMPVFKANGLSHEPKTNLGKFLRKIRLALEKSQLEFAEAIGVSSAVVSGLERGTYIPSSRMLLKISEALGREIPKD